jgi:hypothetical protein
MKILWLIPFLCTGYFLLTPVSAHAINSFSDQNYESCSLITSEYLTVLQLSGRGLDADLLTESLPDISTKAISRVRALLKLVDNTGLSETYSTIYSEYITCAKAVYKRHGTPVSGTREERFYHCAGENKIQYEISMAAIIGAEQNAVIDQLPASHTQMVRNIFALHKERGSDVLLDSLASELKHCINKIM